MYSDIILRSDIDHLVVKRNELVHSHGYLSEGENNLVLLAIILTRLYAKSDERDIKLDATIRVYANDYMKVYGVNRNTAYNAMNEAMNELFDRSFTIKEGGIDVEYRWLVSKAAKKQTSVADGFIEFAFSEKAIQLIADFDHNQGKYTTYGIERVSRLKGRFSGKIYELAMESKNKDVKQTKIFEIEELRKILGIQADKYRDTKGWDKVSPKKDLPTRLDNFKKEVLSEAVEKINLESDITINFNEHRQGRRITGISFSFSFKPDYIPKFAQQELLDAEGDNSGSMLTVKDETKIKKTKKSGAATAPKPQPSNEPQNDVLLGTDLRSEDLDAKEHPFALGYQDVKKTTSEQFDPYKPSQSLYDNYVKSGGELSIKELEEKCRQQHKAASAFVLAEISRLKSNA